MCNWIANFGQDPTFAGNQTAQGNADENGVGDFYFSPPSGFVALKLQIYQPQALTQMTLNQKIQQIILIRCYTLVMAQHLNP